MADGKDVRFGKMSSRQVGMYVIEAALGRVGGCMATLARLTGHSSESISRYRRGEVQAKREFFLDLFDKVSGFGIDFVQVAAPLGFRWVGSRDPKRFRRFSYFFAAIRIREGDKRDLCAAKIGVSESCVRDIEHGFIPERRVLANFVRQYLASSLDVATLKAEFPVLDPSDVELDLRERVLQLQSMGRDTPGREALEHELARELLRMAKPMAWKAGLVFGGRCDAAEVCGEAVFHVMRKFESRRGLLLPYLRKVVGSLIRQLSRIDLQTGASEMLRKYGFRYKSAWQELAQDLGRDPTEREIINYYGLSEIPVIEVSWALRAGYADFVEDLDRVHGNLSVVLHPYDELDRFEGNKSVELVRRLPRAQQELLLMRFIDEVSVAGISGKIGRPEDEVALKLRWAIAQLGG
ncbi:hypothetical protein [Actinoplanes sp. NPDC051494]|uniref:hypothetical protein n=1 Tax=Actinoplanes sp. NPDC051494 TaxID=3363907 RepID=UPI0037B119ED